MEPYFSAKFLELSVTFFVRISFGLWLSSYLFDQYYEFYMIDEKYVFLAICLNIIDAYWSAKIVVIACKLLFWINLHQ